MKNVMQFVETSTQNSIIPAWHDMNGESVLQLKI